MELGEFIRHLRSEKSISQRELAEMSGVSNAEISRIETGERQKPSPDLLRRVAPYLGVAYEELMNRAGYLNERSIYYHYVKEAEENFYVTLSPKLLLEGWSIEPIKTKSPIGDVLAKKDKEIWHIDFKFIRSREDNEKNFRDDMNARHILALTYGRLAMYNDSPITKFTIAVHNKKFYDTMRNYKPYHLNIKVSIMLIDIEENKIIEEHKFY